ncbi:MAG: 4-(cytidine 5'-diphospho)-2-C-methyl-D-erythritol kinase [Spirochaetia bacterium]|nr:4-(cytidine 5'-diphospho)-2-C-methyl-D-erythritol kinase [Spirochaetia bacterium]
MQILAPAKINLFLKVLNRRKDNYHNILSIFRKIGLYDDLTITAERSSSFSCKIIGNFNFPDEENLIWKAAEMFNRFVDFSICFTVTCKKNIPIGSGLGGGSSDAAAVLLAANELMGRPCSKYELKSLSEKLGSDVPFFIDNFSTALITGRGEYIEPISTFPKDYWLVLVYPGFSVSSGIAYEKLDSSYSFLEDDNVITEEAAVLSRILCKQILLSPDSWAFVNDFEKVLLDDYPIYKSIKEQMLLFGALFTLLTGSGSAFFGIFENSSAAKKAANSLRFNLSSSNQIIICPY